MSVTIPKPIPEGATHFHPAYACPDEPYNVFYKQVDGEWFVHSDPNKSPTGWRESIWAEQNLPYCVLIEPDSENDVDNW